MHICTYLCQMQIGVPYHCDQPMASSVFIRVYTLHTLNLALSFLWDNTLRIYTVIAEYVRFTAITL